MWLRITQRLTPLWLLLLALAPAAVPLSVANAQPPRSLTVTKTYTPLNTYTTDDTAQQIAVRFTPPAWTRSVSITVQDAGGPIVYWVRWGGTDAASFNCSIANGSYLDQPTQQQLSRQGRGDLLVAPVSPGYTGFRSQGAVTYRTCPYPYVSVPTTGQISVTFSSRVLPRHKHR